MRVPFALHRPRWGHAAFVVPPTVWAVISLAMPCPALEGDGKRSTGWQRPEAKLGVPRRREGLAQGPLDTATHQKREPLRSSERWAPLGPLHRGVPHPLLSGRAETSPGPGPLLTLLPLPSPSSASLSDAGGPSRQLLQTVDECQAGLAQPREQRGVEEGRKRGTRCTVCRARGAAATARNCRGPAATHFTDGKARLLERRELPCTLHPSPRGPTPPRPAAPRLSS